MRFWILTFIEVIIYEEVGYDIACENSQAFTTYTGSASCDGWKGISLEECKAKCSRNEVPNKACPRQGVECMYVAYKSTWGCHLADATCKPKKKDGSNYIYFKKEG